MVRMGTHHVRRLGIVAGLVVLLAGVLAFADTRRAGEPDEEIVVGTPSTSAPTEVASAPGPFIEIPDAMAVFRSFAGVAEGMTARLRYQAAVDARDAGAYASAAAIFARVGVSDSPLAPIASLRAAQMLGLAGESAEAADAFAALIAVDSLPAPLLSAALMDAAAAFLEAGRTAEAIDAFARVESVPGASAATLASARWEQGALLQEQGDSRWYDLAIAAMQVAPTTPAARDALDAIEEAGIVPPGILAGTVEYRGFRNAAADARFRSLLAAEVLDDEESAAAWFMLGAIAERFGNREGAMEAYASSLAASATGPFADDARYWRGRVAEELGWAAEAITEFDLLVAEYPGSTFADDSRLRAGVIAGTAGDIDNALDRLAAIAGTSSNREVGAEAARWHQILREQWGRTDAPTFSAAAIDPISYAAVLERSAASAVTPFPASAFEEQPTALIVTDAVRAEIEGWIATTFNVVADTPTGILDDPTAVLALGLAQAGEPGVASDLLFSILNANRGAPLVLLEVGLAAHEVGLHDVAMGAATRILGQLSSGDRLQAPVSLLMLAYPAPYLSELREATEIFAVPPLLMLALVRQESAFNPTAGSHAGAFGLTQVIEPTGEAIARELGEEWTFMDLARPAVALRFGTYYLAQQLAAFDGHLLAALAAYNAGPGNGARWLEIAPFEGADGYIHGVDFTETRLYLELVTENYAMYRLIYAGAPAPSLP